MYARVFITELPNNSIHKHFWMMSEADQSRKKGGSFQTWLDEIFQKNPIVFSDPKWMTFNDGRNMTNDPNILVSTLCFGGTMLFCITSGTDYPLFSEYKWITNKIEHRKITTFLDSFYCIWKHFSNSSAIIKNPGLQHIAENVFLNLTSGTTWSCWDCGEAFLYDPNFYYCLFWLWV